MTRVFLVLTVVPAIASAQADTTRRRDTTQVPRPQDTTRRVQAEARGEIDLTRLGARRFGADLPNHGLSTDQAIELQQALTRVGCDVGTIDGIVGQQTLRGIECFRSQQNAGAVDLESLLTALKVSFAKPAEPAPPPVASPSPPRRDTTVLPPVLRPDSNYRADVIARRDSALRRDSLRLDSLRRDSTARRDTTKPER